MIKIGRRDFAQMGSFGLLSSLVPSWGANRFSIEPKGDGRSLSKEFLAELPRLMDLANVPGLAVAVVAEGKVAWARGFGVRKAGASETVDENTVFGAASLSKPVFAYALLKLREEKLIDLDRPLSNYLADSDLPDDPRAKQITARHALSHTTGLQNWRFNKDQKLFFSFAPGEGFGYSGEGYFLLQRIVEQISGKSFEEFMRERVFKPFGMTNSSYLWAAEHEARLSWGHNGRGQPQEPWNARQGRKMLELAKDKPLSSWKYEDIVRAMPQIEQLMPALPNFMIPNCAGSLLTTASDYAKFMTKIFDGAAKDAFTISEASRREMFAPQVKLNSALSWGLGWGLEDEHKESAFWHWGDNGTFKTFAFGIPARRWSMVVLTNGSNGHKLWQRIVTNATGRDHASFLWWMA